MDINKLCSVYGGTHRKTKVKLDLARKNLINENKILEEQLKEKQDIKRKMLIAEGTNSLKHNRGRIKRLTFKEKSKYKKELTEALFIESIFDIFDKSLLLDEDFKEKYRGNFYNLVESTVKNFMQENNLTIKNINEKCSGIMSEIIEICENTATHLSEEKYKLDYKNADIINESKKECSDYLKIDLGTKSDFSSEKDFATKNIAAIVKEKVVKTISDEQKTAQKEEELINQIDIQLNKNDDIDNEIISSDEEMNEETEPKNNDDTDEFEGDPGEDANKSENSTIFKNSVHRKRIIKPKKISENSLFKSILISISNKNTKEILKSESSDVSLDMDLVFAESIAYYTLLETLYTTKILNITPSEARTMAINLLIKK